MKRFWQEIIIVGIFVLCTAAYPTNLNHLFVDREYGYSIRYPDGWHARLCRSGVVLSEINSSDGKSGLQIRRVYIKGNLETFINDYIKQFKRDTQASFVAKNKRKIGGVSGWVLTFKRHRIREQLLLKSYILPSPHPYYIYIFQAGAPLDTQETIEPVLDGIAYSFETE